MQNENNNERRRRVEPWEAGPNANRVFGTPLFGITFGPQRQVYYLIVAWALLAAWGMHALRRTPGRMANAARVVELV